MKRFSRFSLISLSLLLLLALFAVGVYAQNYDISNAFGEVAKIINEFAKAFRSPAVIEGFVRFAFWVFVFAGISVINAFERVKDNKTAKRAVTLLAIILATYGAFRVPSKLIVILFNIPYVFLVLVWAFITPAVGFLINKKLFHDDEKRSHRFGRAVVYILIVLLMLSIIDIIQKNAGADAALFLRMMWPLRIGTAIALLFGLVNLAMALGGDKVVEKLSETFGKKKEEKPGTAPPGAGAHGAAAHAPPPNPAEIVELRGRINTFLLEFAGTSAHAQNIQNLIGQIVTEHNTHIVPNPPSPARQAEAQRILQIVHDTNIIRRMEELTELSKQILENHQYRHVPDAERINFERAAAAYLALQTQFTVAHRNILAAA